MCSGGCLGEGVYWRVCSGGCVEKDVGVVCYRCECGGGVKKVFPHRGLPDSS